MNPDYEKLGEVIFTEVQKRINDRFTSEGYDKANVEIARAVIRESGLLEDNAKAWDRVQYLQDHISMIRTDCLNGRFKDVDQVSNELFLAYQGEREAQ